MNVSGIGSVYYDRYRTQTRRVSGKDEMPEKECYRNFVEKLDTLTNETGAVKEQPEDYRKFLQKKSEEILEKLRNGETEVAYPIGSQYFTEKEWDKLLEKFDSIEETLRKSMREAYAKREKEMTEAEHEHPLENRFYTAEEKETKKVLGLTMMPYSDTVSYGMSAFYSEASTEADPIIRIHSNYGGEEQYYDVHVNKVDPGNATQLEMFALSCYLDDQGVTERGTFGSYVRMKVYAQNDAYLGRGTDLQRPENAESKMDWLVMLHRMAEEYLQNAQTYIQYLDCGKLATTLEKWKVS